MIFVQRELEREAMGIASNANYEQCLVTLKHWLSDAALLYRPLSRRLDRCDRVIQDEVGDSIRGNV